MNITRLTGNVLIYLILFGGLMPHQLSAQSGRKYNVLFIIADDLNDYVGSLKGHPLSGHSLRGLLEDPVIGGWDGGDVAVTAISKNWVDRKQSLKLSVKELLDNQQYSIRSKGYRYVYVSGKEIYLYDLVNDPIEEHNLSGKTNTRRYSGNSG